MCQIKKNQDKRWEKVNSHFLLSINKKGLYYNADVDALYYRWTPHCSSELIYISVNRIESPLMGVKHTEQFWWSPQSPLNQNKDQN